MQKCTSKRSNARRSLNKEIPGRNHNGNLLFRSYCISSCLCFCNTLTPWMCFYSKSNCGSIYEAQEQITWRSRLRAKSLSFCDCVVYGVNVKFSNTTHPRAEWGCLQTKAFVKVGKIKFFTVSWPKKLCLMRLMLQNLTEGFWRKLSANNLMPQ